MNCVVINHQLASTEFQLVAVSQGYVVLRLFSRIQSAISAHVCFLFAGNLLAQKMRCLLCR